MDTQPELFAHHYSEAGLVEKSIVCWGKAGHNSVARSAMAEAAAQYHVEQEYKPFPVAVHDDFFDAISRICDEELGATWPPAAASRKPDRYARARRRQRKWSQWAA